MKATINKFVTILLVSVILSLLVGGSGATWCDSDYAKRINVSVNNTGGSALTDYQVYVNLSANPINETSLRVYNSSDCTSRDFWCEETSAGNCTKLWINYSVVTASTWTNNTAIYYDNTAASSASNITNTFSLGDDFLGSSLDTSKWSAELKGTGASVSVTGSECKLDVPDNQVCSANIQSVDSFTNNIAIHIRRKCPNDIEYIEFSLGSGAITDTYSDQGYWWYTSKYSGYFTYINMHDGDATLNEIYEVPVSGDKVVLTDVNATFTDAELNNYRTHQHIYDSSGNLKWYLLSESDRRPLGEEFEKYASNPLSIPDYGEAHGAVHPDALYFPSGEDGYKYWLYYETVGTSNAEYLDLVRSNDGINFVDTGVTNHILSPGSGGSWDDLWVADSSIIKVGSTWYMYYCGGQTINTQIGLANSTDGKTWTKITDGIGGTSKVLEANTSLTSEGGNQLVSPAAYYDGSVFWLWYVSKKTNGNYSLCLANSTDGKNWIRYASNPVWDPDNGEEIWHIDITKHSGYYYCYFNHGSTGHLRLLKSADKTNWVLADNDPVLKYTEAWEGTHIYESGPAADVYGNLELIDNKMWLYYSTNGGTGDTYEIGLAKSWENIDVGSDDRLLATTIDTTFLSDGKKILITQGAYSATGRGTPSFLDWAFVRKYTSPEPSTTLGSEEQQGANPILHINNAINIKEDWGRDFNSNLSANVTTANASGVWMNFTNSEFTNTSLGWLNLTLNEWVNESHNVNAPVTNVSVNISLNSTTSGATNDTDSFWYEVTKRTNTAAMNSAATQNVDTSESFYINGTCNEEYGDTFLGAANLLEDGAIMDTDTSVTNYVNFSYSESSAGQYNYTIRFYNLTHYDNTTTTTYSNVTVSDVEYIPPDAINLQNVTGNFWINHTWSMGIPGNITDSYNIYEYRTRVPHAIWHNGTTNTYLNSTNLLAHHWSNVTVWAYNNSGSGTLSSGSISGNVRIPNNPITVTVTESYNKLETEIVFISDTSSSDIDGDSPTYSCNRTDLFIDFSTVTGYGNWTTGTTDSGVYHVDIGVSDGWSSTDNKTLTITIEDATPGTPSGLANTTGNFWINHTWTNGVNTDTFNVSVNLSWNNGSSNEYYNNTPLSAHKWSNISVYGFNSTSGELSSSISQNTQIPNNLPTLSGLPDNTTDEDVNQTDIFDLDDYFTDADGDTPTYLVESNNQSAYVSVTINVSNNVSYTLASGWNGTASIVINVTDGWSGEDNDTFLIIVNAAPLPGDYIPGDPTTLQNTTGNYWVNYTWNVGGGNVTDSYNVSWNLTWYNTTTDTFMKKETGASNWANITVYAFNSSGNGTLSSGYLSDEVQAPAFVPGDYIPPNPTTLLNSTGNYYVNYTWVMGVPGNITDSYNVSWNLSWFNGTLTTYMQKEVGASNWGNITVYAYNSSGNGTLSAGSLSDNVQSPAFVPGDYTPPNPTTLANTTGNYWVNFTWSSGGGANITDSYNVSWNLTWFNNTLTTYMQKDVGASGWANITIYAFNSSGNGSLSTGYVSDEAQAPSAPIGDYVPPNPVNLVNSSGNGWVNYTWNSGAGNITDSYNVSWNLTWYNTTLTAYMNDTVGEFGWANISVWAFNSSGNGSLSAGSISDETQAEGGTYTTPMGTTAYNLITYYGSSTSTAEQFGIDIGSVDYIAMYNGSFYTHTMGHIGNNFTTYHGIGYYVYLNASGSSTYQRNNISDSPYNTQLYNRWNTIGWTNATNTDAEGLATSIGSACKYTSMLNADGVTYTTHTVGFSSNNHAVNKGKGYWVWTNAGVSWSRNS